MTRKTFTLFDPTLARPAVVDAFRKLDPRVQWRNPVMFVVYVGSDLHHRACGCMHSPARARPGRHSSSPSRCGCGSRCCSPTSPRHSPRAAARRRPPRCAACKKSTWAKKLHEPHGTARSGTPIEADSLRKGDVVLVEAHDVIPADGEVIEGVASVDESAITGESAPVIRESGGDFSRGDRRHARAVRLDRGARHRQPGRDLRRPHDRDGRERQAPEDAERDRARPSCWSR